MDEHLLRLFLQNPNTFLSGEDLSNKLDCSRTAVWKHIQSLKTKGYEFDAVPRKGYRLIRKPVFFDSDTLLASLNTKVLGRYVHIVNQIDSTQTLMHHLAGEGASEGTIVIAEQQTKGRGRRGKPWHSPAGKGIWMSLLLRPHIPMQQVPQLTLLVAVAVNRAIRKLMDVNIGIKWPNDLLIDGKKVCGILLESSAEDERIRYVAVGIGISANLKKEDYPAELQSIATSLVEESGQEVDRTLLVSTVLEEIEDLYDLFHQEGFAPIRLLWEALSITLERTVKVNTPQGIIQGTAVSIDESGALVVALSNGDKISVFSGDIEFAIMK